MSDWTLRARKVTKSYDKGDTFANRDMSITVGAGEVYGLLGPNGSGKSTLVKQIIGLLKPDAGSIHLGTHDLVADPHLARQLCSYLPQAPMPIDSFKLREAVLLIGEIRGGTKRAVSRRADELIEALELGEWRSTIGAQLSGGIRRLVGFAMVAVVPGRVVILDEPTNDVDPLRRRLLWDQIRRLGEMGSAVFLVSHNVLEVERAVDRLAVIFDGELQAEGTPSSLKTADAGHLRLRVMLRPGSPNPDLPALATGCSRVGNTFDLTIDESLANHGIVWAQQLMETGVAEEYALGATSLEDAYIRLTGERVDQNEKVLS